MYLGSQKRDTARKHPKVLFAMSVTKIKDAKIIPFWALIQKGFGELYKYRSKCTFVMTLRFLKSSYEDTCPHENVSLNNVCVSCFPNTPRVDYW